MTKVSLARVFLTQKVVVISSDLLLSKCETRCLCDWQLFENSCPPGQEDLFAFDPVTVAGTDGGVFCLFFLRRTPQSFIRTRCTRNSPHRSVHQSHSHKCVCFYFSFQIIFSFLDEFWIVN